jgi:hypothetical protein
MRNRGSLKQSDNCASAASWQATLPSTNSKLRSSMLLLETRPQILKVHGHASLDSFRTSCKILNRPRYRLP